jgi:two-component system chemotaxis sensor kinase CheA
LELVRLEGAQARKGIEQLYGTPVYRLRGQLLPLAYLNQQFKVAPATPKAGSQAQDDVVNIIVLQADGRHFGLVVDEINDTEEIVVKPLGKQLKGLTCFAGATIMGDGRVALILDVVGLAQHANVVSETRDRAVADDKAKSQHNTDAHQTLLLFSIGKDRRMAIPLSLAARLEEFSTSRIERTGSQEVVQYRGQILPLIHVADHVAGHVTPHDPSDTLQVVVCTEQGRSYGLIVSQINDIVDEAVTITRTAAARGILGSAVVQERVTDLLDVPGLIRAADATCYQTAG